MSGKENKKISPVERKYIKIFYETSSQTLISFVVRRFIGELYRATILTTKIMHRCIKQLLQQNTKESMECLCKLFETIGTDIESRPGDLRVCFFVTTFLY